MTAQRLWWELIVVATLAAAMALIAVGHFIAHYQ